MPPEPRNGGPDAAEELGQRQSGNVLVVNATAQESRIALVENGVCAELYIERVRDRGLVGNIYKGKVVRVLPGMQAAFVDVGLEKAAFLYVGDIHLDPATYGELAERDNGRGGERDEEEDGRDGDGSPGRAPDPDHKHPSIDELLKEGQEIVVQVAKDPIGTKGCRVTTHVSLPGRHLVYMPHIDHIGISRRIGDERERERLRQIVDKIKPEHGGFIVRTVSEGVSQRKLRYDMEILQRSWEAIRAESERIRAPAVLYNDYDAVMRAARDLFTDDIDQIIIDSREHFERIQTFVAQYNPKTKHLVQLYEGREPIFDHYGIEMEINRALNRKVWLKSGGYLIIDQTEAATTIDVNTGRYVGSRNLEETILKTNLEAVKEIVAQLRLRNIGGIIILDIIDMEKQANREKVYNALRDELKKDRAKTNILQISQFGLVEMTRKRVRESLGRLLCEPCFYCDGKGYLKSKTTIAFEVLREIQREAPNIRGRQVQVNVHPDISDLLFEEEQSSLSALERRYDKKIQLRALPYFHLEQYEVVERQAAPHGKPKPTP